MKVRVGVVRGGPSSEYEVSIRTGASVLKHLPEEKYIGTDLWLSKAGEWHRNGIPTDLEDIQHNVDIVFNALHGYFGEDGKVQALFEQFGIPYTGSGVLPSAIAMHKGLTKEHVLPLGIKVPRGETILQDEAPEKAAFRVFRSFPLPVIVKPITGGSSVATSIVKSYQELVDAIDAAQDYGDVLIEEFIKGREATVCVIDTKDGKDVFALHPIEIIPPPDRTFFDYEAKYGGETKEIYPGNFSETETAHLRAAASAVHQGLRLRHYSRSDFIVSPRGIYFLEVNTLPGLTDASLLPKALASEGITLPEFLDHILELARKSH